MRIRFIGHACALISHEGFSLITDPWLEDSFHFGVYHAYPPRAPLSDAEIAGIQAIHISHVHVDHFCERSLSRFPKSIPVLIAKYPEPAFRRKLEDLGFSNVIEVEPGQEGYQVGPFMFHSFLPSVFNGSCDSACVIRQGEHSVFFNNDCVLSAATLRLIYLLFGPMDGAFLGYQSISPYPICYDYSACETFRIRPTRAMVLSAAKADGWAQFAQVCGILAAKWAVPYASGVRFLTEDLLKFNEMFSDPYEALPLDLGTTRAVVLEPGSEIDVSGEMLLQPRQSYAPADVAKRVLGAFSFGEPSEPEALGLPGLEALFWKSIRAEARRWKKPMAIQIVVRGETSEARFGFRFDGREVNAVHESSENSPDLTIAYPASALSEVLRGRLTLSQVHFAYQIFVRVYKYIPAQQLVHAWGARKAE